MAEDVKKAKEKVITQTLNVLEKTLINMPLKNDMPMFLKRIMRETVIDRIIDLFSNDSTVDVFNILEHLVDLKKYSDKSFMFDYKMGELINSLKSKIECTKPEMFTLN